MKIYWRLVRYIRPYIGLLIFGVIVTTVHSGIQVGFMGIANEFIDNLATELDVERLERVVWLIAIGTIAVAIMRYAGDYIFYHISNCLIRDLRIMIFNKVITVPINFFEEHTTGNILQWTNGNVNMMKNGVTAIARDFVSNMVKLVGYMGILLYINWKWTVLVLICGPIVAGPLSIIAKRIKKFAKATLETSGELLSATKEMAEGIRVIKAYSLEANLIANFTRLNHQQVKNIMKSIKYSELPRPLIMIITAVFLSLALYYSGLQVIEGNMSLANYATFFGTCFALQPVIRALGHTLGKLNEASAAAEQVFVIMDRDSECQDVSKRDEMSIPDFMDSISFTDITFTYDSATEPALNQFTLDVKRGETVALVGFSGAGKTTVTDLLLGFYQAQSGDITIDGRSFASAPLSEWRARIAVVTQHTFLFDGNVRNNIAFGALGSVSDDDVEAAAKAANAHNFIMELDGGYQAPIGEGGSRLSGGQRQRLAIARALVRNAPILILDEATSALDRESEREVQLALDNLMENRTVIVVAHRMSTIEKADKIVVMEQGKIVDMGRHQELLANSPTYQRLFDEGLSQ